VIGWLFRFCFRLRQSSFHWIISDGVVNGIGRNGNVLILPTPIPSSLWLRLWLRFSIFTRSQALLRLRKYVSDYDTDSDSVASESQPSLISRQWWYLPLTISITACRVWACINSRTFNFICFLQWNSVSLDSLLCLDRDFSALIVGYHSESSQVSEESFLVHRDPHGVGLIPNESRRSGSSLCKLCAMNDCQAINHLLFDCFLCKNVYHGEVIIITYFAQKIQSNRFRFLQLGIAWHSFIAFCLFVFFLHSRSKDYY